ncbi:MAG: serine/threonine protein kinase [Phycisphaerales bacterium]|nr:serine/threonine protein kinase [Phycisphaerales bacterium]
MSEPIPSPPLPPDPMRAERLWSLLEDRDLDEGEDSRSDDPAHAWPSIPGYRVVEAIGEGGSAAVFRGFREGSAAPVAIKVIRRGEVTEVGQQRAWRELEILTRLRTPSVPRILDYGVCGGQLFIVTDYVDGRPLDQDEGVVPSTLRQRVELLASIATAVQGIHEFGVIHRDLKPANILIDSTGRPMVIDFGIALLHEDAPANRTETGVPVGSPAFMAPEQARGERERVSTRTDVYGLGAVGYVLLTGEPPHPQGTALHETIRAVAQDPGRDPLSLRPSLPRPLAAVLAKAVERDPARRYASADELAEDLRRWLTGETVLAGSPTRWRRFGRWIARHPVVTTTVACLAIACTSLLATETTIWWIAQRPAYVYVAPDRSWAELRSTGGNNLRSWFGKEPEDIVVAYLANQAAPRGIRRFVVIAALKTTDAATDPGELCFFDASELERPYWTSANTISLPAAFQAPSTVDRSHDRFRLRWAKSWDIFPDHPGDEVVAVHCHVPYSPAVIRVYAATGEVLFEAWHDGELQDGYWMEDAKLLVLTGVNSDGTWEERGGGAIASRYPRVVFAIRPELGRVGAVLSWEGHQGTLEPEWYHCILPPRVGDLLENAATRVEPPPLGYSPNASVMLSIKALTPTASGYRWIIGADGKVLSDYPVQGWVSNGTLPRPDEMALGALPRRTAGEDAR